MAVGMIASLPAFANPNQPLIYCSEASPEGFNPQFYTAGSTFDVTEMIYDTLTDFKSGTTEVVPALAERWEISQDELTYTFYLRKGVKFHSNRSFTPTRDFNADDVIFTIERQKNPDHPYHRVSGGNYAYFYDLDMANIIKEVKKVDDYTLEIVLSQPYAPFISNLGMAFSAILSAEYADKMMEEGTPQKVDLEPIGAGPYQLTAYQKDAQVRFSAHDGYWDNKPHQKTLIFAITPDATVRYQRLAKGECHVMAYPNIADLDAMQANEDLKVLNLPGLNIGYVSYNVTKKPFDNIHFRKALDRAIDKEAIIEAVFQGNAIPGFNPMAPAVVGFHDTIEDPGFNLDEARLHLEESGVKNPQIKLWAMPVSRPYNPNARRMAEIMQANWAKIGIDTQIVSYEWGEYLKRARNGESDALLIGWTGDNGDADNFLSPLFTCAAAESGGNSGKWCNEEFDDLVYKAAQTSNVEERVEFYKEAQEVFARERPSSVMVHSIVYEVTRQEVEGYTMSPLGRHFFYGVSLR